MAEKRGHWVKEGRVFVQDEDGTFLELVPMPDGNFNTKPAKKEDVRGADFIEGPFDPQRAAFAGQKLPGETPPAPAPPGPPMPPGYTLTAEEEQEVGASAEAAQQQAEQRLADEPMDDLDAADKEFSRSLYNRALGGEYKWGSRLPPDVAVAGIEKLGMDPETVFFHVEKDTVLPYANEESYLNDFPDADPSDLSLGISAAQAEMETLPEEVEEEAPTGEGAAAEEEEVVQELDEDVVEEAQDNPELAAEVAELEDMSGRERISYILKNRKEFPEFNAALRGAAEQFYRDRRFKTATQLMALGDYGTARQMVQDRDMPQRLERAELQRERERLLSLQENAKKFNIELKRGEYSTAASLVGSMLDTITQRRGQLEGYQQRSSELASSQRHATLLHNLKERSDALKAAREASEAAGHGGKYGGYEFSEDALMKGREAIAKALSNVESGVGFSDAEAAALRISLVAASGVADDPLAAHAFINYLGHSVELDDAMAAIGADEAKNIVMGGTNGLGQRVKEMGTDELIMNVMQQTGMDNRDATRYVNAYVLGGNLYPWENPDPNLRVEEAEARAVEAEAMEEANYDRAYNDAVTGIGSGIPDGKQRQAFEETMQLLGSDDPDRSLVEIARATTLGGPEGTGGIFEGAPLFDADSYTADLQEVETALAETSKTPMERHVENIRATETGDRAINALVARGMTEEQAVAKLVEGVGRRSFKRDDRAERRVLRGKPRAGDEEILLGEASPEAPEEPTPVATSGLTGATTGAPLEGEEFDPAAGTGQQQRQMFAGGFTPSQSVIHEGAKYETPASRKLAANQEEVLRSLGLAT